MVGEVELTRELNGAGGQALEDGEKERMSKKLDSEIEEFMRYHAWAFPTEEPVGKLSAYFAWKTHTERVNLEGYNTIL